MSMNWFSWKAQSRWLKAGARFTTPLPALPLIGVPPRPFWPGARTGLLPIANADGLSSSPIIACQSICGAHTTQINTFTRAVALVSDAFGPGQYECWGLYTDITGVPDVITRVLRCGLTGDNATPATLCTGRIGIMGLRG